MTIRHGLRAAALICLILIPGLARAQQLASLTYPTNGLTSVDLSKPVQWTSVTGAQAYYLYVGTTLGAKDLVNSGEIQQTSYTPRPAIPSGQMVYARLWTKLAGVWAYTDSTFGALASNITVPRDHDTMADYSQPVQWASIANAQAYYLWIGATPGASDLVDSGELHTTSFKATLPRSQTLYARLWTKVADVWRYTDISFSSFLSVLTTPANGATNVDVTLPMRWAAVPGAQSYYLYVGTAVGAHDLLNTGETPVTSYTPRTALPTGQMLYARLWTEVAGVWGYTDTTFGALTATITAPRDGETMADYSQPVQWSTIANAQAYYLWIGTTAGAKDLVDSGEVHTTSFKATLPRNQTVYARLWTKVAGAWRYSDSSFASFLSVLTTPSNGSISADFTQPLQWTTVPGAQAYYLYVGTSVGAKDLVNTGETQLTSLLTHLSVNQTLYARIWTKRGDKWGYTDSTFSSVASALTYPRNLSTTANSARPFQWSPVPNASAYYLYVGTTRGAKDLVNTGEIHTTSFQSNALPAGQILYARLWTEIAGVWRYVDSTFTALPAQSQIQSTDLVYEGSFRVPHVASLVDPNGLGLDYGGTALGFNPFANSLYMVGHDWDQRSTEIAIPPMLGTGSDVTTWPTALALQPLLDGAEGHLQDIVEPGAAANAKVGAQFVYNGHLYLSTYVYYGYSTAPTFFRRNLSLTPGSLITGGMAVGPFGPDFTNGYMGLIPTEWQTPLGGPVLVGNCCINVVSRSSYGPAAFAIDLDALNPSTTTASVPLLAYPTGHTTLGNWGDPGINLLFNGTSRITGVVFPSGTSSVLFFGRQGIGPYCYDEGTTCNDPDFPNRKGDHAYPYVSYVWAYDAHDLATVRAGASQPWDIKPYAVWKLTLPLIGADLGGAAYDPVTGRIFISQQFSDGGYPVVHVFTLR
jgi:hypothetical protein